MKEFETEERGVELNSRSNYVDLTNENDVHLQVKRYSSLTLTVNNTTSDVTPFPNVLDKQ